MRMRMRMMIMEVIMRVAMVLVSLMVLVLLEVHFLQPDGKIAILGTIRKAYKKASKVTKRNQAVA